MLEMWKQLLLEHTPNTSTIVKAETATALKSDTMNTSKLASQCTPAGDHETSSPIQFKETRIDTKPPMCAELVSTQADDTYVLNHLSNNYSLHYMWQL